MFCLRKVSIPIQSASSPARLISDRYRSFPRQAAQYRWVRSAVPRTDRSIFLPLIDPPLRVSTTTMSTSGRFADRRTTKGVLDYSNGGGGLLESISRATREIAGSPIHAAQTPSRASPRYSEGRPSDGHEITLPPRENADEVYESRDAKNQHYPYFFILLFFSPDFYFFLFLRKSKQIIFCFFYLLKL